MAEDIKQAIASIAAELREYPERWTQGTGAKTAQGKITLPTSPDAVCWCLAGHMARRGISMMQRDGASKALGFEYFSDLANWNDSPHRTVGDIIYRCEAFANG